MYPADQISAHSALQDHLAGGEGPCCPLSKNPTPTSAHMGPGYLTPFLWHPQFRFFSFSKNFAANDDLSGRRLEEQQGCL